MISTARTDAPPAGWKPVEVLTKSASGLGGRPAHVDQRLLAGEVQQRRGLDDDLQHRRRGPRPDGGDVGADGGEVAAHGRADVDDHVDLVGARGDGQRGLAAP